MKRQRGSLLEIASTKHGITFNQVPSKGACPPVDEAAKEILLAICNKHGYQVKGLEVMPDHIHLFMSIPPAQPLATAVKLVKGVSARMLLTRFPQIKQKLWGGHLWNPSYYVGTAGHVSNEIIQKYIERQKDQDVTEP